jgi:hypothetical protein
MDEINPNVVTDTAPEPHLDDAEDTRAPAPVLEDSPSPQPGDLDDGWVPV